MRVFLAVAVFLLASSAWGQVASGPKAGDPVPALKVFAVTGQEENKELDYSAERKEKPTVYVFIQAEQWSRPMARFLKTLDQQIKKDSDDAYIVAVWLTEKPDDTKEYLPKAQQSLQFDATALTYYPGDKAGPNDWTINSMAHATVVVTHKKKIAACFGFMSINETDVPAVREALRRALTQKK